MADQKNTVKERQALQRFCHFCGTRLFESDDYLTRKGGHRVCCECAESMTEEEQEALLDPNTL